MPGAGTCYKNPACVAPPGTSPLNPRLSPGHGQDRAAPGSAGPALLWAPWLQLPLQPGGGALATSWEVMFEEAFRRVEHVMCV